MDHAGNLQSWLHKTVEKHEKLLAGERGQLGIVNMVQIMWRTYVLLLCALSGSAGSLVTYMVMKG